jgi:hypothetical protein
MKPSFYFSPILWSINFSKECLIDFNLDILAISKYTPAPEMFLFGLSFCLRKPLFFAFTIFGFQLYLSLYTIRIYWPNGTSLWHIWERQN